MKNIFAAVAGRQDLASRISNIILAMLEKGVRAWTQPWENGNTGRITRPSGQATAHRMVASTRSCSGLTRIRKASPIPTG